MNHLVDDNTTPNGDRFETLVPILGTLGTDLVVSSTEMSVGTRKLSPVVKTLALIMYSNLYPLTNTGFINIGKVRFLVDLMTRAQIDICAYIFQIMGKAVGR